MSSDYYFIKWRDTVRRIEELVDLDHEFQRVKIHDKNLCEAVIRLCGMLGEYMAVYNDVLDCWQENLQVQKTAYMLEVIKAITNRILELKSDIKKLECSDTQFLGHGLANHKLTPFDVELEDLPTPEKRPALIEIAITEAFRRAEEKKEQMRLAEEEANKVDEEENVENWWDDDSKTEDESVFVVAEKKEPETEEMIATRQMASLIQAHERNRKVIQWLVHKKQKREIWEKEIKGTLKPPAPLEIRERGAKIIQKAMRAYFEIKRRKIRACRENEILGIGLCKPFNKEAIYLASEIKAIRCDHRKTYENEWTEFKEQLKTDYQTRKIEEIAEDYRDFIYAWFRRWFDEIKLFYDIPRKDEGGSTLIMKEEIPDPIEYWQIYQAYLEEKKANKNKSSQQLKFEKEEAKREEKMQKREEQLKKKLEDKLKQKLMKNPTKHPGYDYPKSNKTESILEVIDNYRNDWDDLDRTEVLEVKKRFVPEVDINNVYAEVKMEIIQTVDDDMRNKEKNLKRALKKDYATNEEPYPEPMKKPRKREKKKKKVNVKMSDIVADKLEDLAFREILKECPKTRLGDFLGDPNFAGDDLRCTYRPALKFAGEIRAYWWDRCREATHGYHKILVVGPRLSGKTVLVNALATITDAVLYELDPLNLLSQSSDKADIQKTVNSVMTCAKITQPAVIHIKHIHRLYYSKIPPEEAEYNFDVLKRSVQKMLKKINKTDRIAVIGTCLDPWQMKSKQILKQFPTVVMVPDTSYSAVFQILNYWLSANHIVPRNLDINSLAFVLRGYSYGYLQKTLQEFLSADEIVRIAAYGLTPMDVYNFFLLRGIEKIDYAKYMKWYTEKTAAGMKEAKHIEEQKEFKQLMEKYAEKKNQAKKKTASALSSGTTLQSVLETETTDVSR